MFVKISSKNISIRDTDNNDYLINLTLNVDNSLRKKANAHEVLSVQANSEGSDAP